MGFWFWIFDIVAYGDENTFISSESQVYFHIKCSDLALNFRTSGQNKYSQSD